VILVSARAFDHAAPQPTDSLKYKLSPFRRSLTPCTNHQDVLSTHTLTFTRRQHPTDRLGEYSTVPAPPRTLPASARTPNREGNMAEMAQRILMNEFKQLSKEKWTNIEVRLGDIHSSVTVIVAMQEHRANHVTAHQRERLRVECRPDSHERRVHVLRRLLQGQDDLPSQLPA